MGEKKTEIQVCLVDDHPIVRRGLAELINQEQDMRVCAEAGNADAAVAVITEKCPDISLVDISLGNSNGLNLIGRLRNECPDMKILVLSMHDEKLYAERVLKAGAQGYVMKEEATEHVVEAIRAVMTGQIHLSKQMAGHIWHDCPQAENGAGKSPVSSLTNRELEVFELIGRGMTTREISQHLDLGVKTIETYRARIKQKLNLKNAVDLVRHATQWVCQ